jgi:hypothetical protein
MRRFCSIFSQLLQLFPRNEFQRLVQSHSAERGAKGFSCWNQFVAMVFCQLGRAQSLREICGGLASCEGRLQHLGATPPARSTLAYANEHRPWELYQSVFFSLLTKCQAESGRHRFRFKNKLLSIDATTIELCAEVFPWATFRRRKGAVKLHITLDHDGYLPTLMVVTEGKRHESKVARYQRFEPGTILVFDMAYTDFHWFRELTDSGVVFVTRLKDNADYEVIRRREVPTRGHVLADEIIRMTGPLTSKKYPGELRRVAVYVPEDERTITLLTNHLDFGPTTIARIYKDRWQIELLFKVLKQNLRVKTFVGTSANALHIQLWTALIALLIVKYLKLKASYGWSLSNLMALLRMNLFVYRDLWEWLDTPFASPPLLDEAEQMALRFA